MDEKRVLRPLDCHKSDVLRWVAEYVDMPWLREVVEGITAGTVYTYTHFMATGLVMQILPMTREDIKLLVQVFCAKATLPESGPVRLFWECARWPQTIKMDDPGQVKSFMRCAYNLSSTWLEVPLEELCDTAYQAEPNEYWMESVEKSLTRLCRARLQIEAALNQMSRVMPLGEATLCSLRQMDREAVVHVASLPYIDIKDEMLRFAAAHHTAWWTKPMAPTVWDLPADFGPAE